MNPSGPAANDSETADENLSRKFAFNTADAATPWLNPEQRAAAADKAVDAFDGIEQIAVIKASIPKS